MAGVRPDSWCVVPSARTEFRYHVDRTGRQHFNFAQRVWLRRSVRMACTRAPSTALVTLAVNLLTMVLKERDRRAAVGITCQRAIGLARQFAEDCLLTAPEEAWVMPRDAIEAWIRSRSGSSVSSGARIRRGIAAERSCMEVRSHRRQPSGL
jgi:hypothetical protein